MSKVLVIGAGGVGSVVTQTLVKMGFDVCLASRTKSKCDKIAERVDIQTAAVDADNVEQTVQLIKSFDPNLVVNVALPYQDLPLMDACLETGVSYLDTANYEPKDEAKFEYSWQWAYRDRFKEKGITAILGCGFDPGVTGVFTAYAAKHHFDEIHTLDIVDCNGGDHGKAFATNFNPEINIREITQNGRYFDDGQWIETEPLEISQTIDYPQIGPRKSYLLFHEELESLVKNFPSLRTARFWMTFSEQYINYLNVLQDVGMTSIEPIKYQGVDIVPLQFLKEVLPEPAELGENYSGETSIGCKIKGVENGHTKSYYVYNNCKHQDAFNSTGNQAVSYTTGVPASIGAKLFLEGRWDNGPGVFNVEEFNPDPFMNELPEWGLPWHERISVD